MCDRRVDTRKARFIRDVWHYIDFVMPVPTPQLKHFRNNPLSLTWIKPETDLVAALQRAVKCKYHVFPTSARNCCGITRINKQMTHVCI